LAPDLTAMEAPARNILAEAAAVGVVSVVGVLPLYPDLGPFPDRSPILSFPLLLRLAVVVAVGTAAAATADGVLVSSERWRIAIWLTLMPDEG
jgi:hypothetical protein